MYNQRDKRWKDIKLGFGSGSIGNYGCYLVSLCNGLLSKGWDFTPETLNTLLKEKGLYTGEFRNYIDVGSLHAILPDIFVSFEKVEPWGAKPTLDEIVKDDVVALGKVDASVIGGTGTHFILITGKWGKVAVIYDPWTGVEERITKRWSEKGFIQGLRLFKVKKFKPVEIPSDIRWDVLEPIIKTESDARDAYDRYIGWDALVLDKKNANKKITELNANYKKLEIKYNECTEELKKTKKQLLIKTNMAKTKLNPVLEALKEPARLLVLAILPFGITYLAGFNSVWAVGATLLLRTIDKYLHKSGTLELGLTRF